MLTWFWPKRLLLKGSVFESIMPKNVAYVYSLVTLMKFLTCPLRCSALAGLCIGASPGGGDGVWACAWVWTPESRRPLRVDWDTDCSIRSVENPEPGTEIGLCNTHICNICGWKEHTLTCCVSCWTESTGPEWSCVTSSMWMCVSRCMWRCMNVLGVVHCSVLNV